MKVTIDTKEDSHEDISKVLHLLTTILEKKNSNFYKNSEDIDSTSMMNMFDSPQSAHSHESLQVNQPVQDRDLAQKATAPDFTSFLNLGGIRKEEDKKEPKIEFF